MNRKKYKCINTFYLPTIDDDGGVDEEKLFEIQKHSLWILRNSEDIAYSMTGAELILDSVEGYKYIEITIDILNNYFEELQNTN